jgi:hypothetical protein
VTSVTSCETVHGAAFSAYRIPAFIGETEGSAVPVPVEYGQYQQSTSRVHNQFAVSYRRELRRLLL